MDRSHAPLSRPHRMDDALVEPILAMKRRFPHFGPKKVKARLEVEQPRVTWPAASTIGAYLKAAGLVEPKTRRRRAPRPGPDRHVHGGDAALDPVLQTHGQEAGARRGSGAIWSA